VETGDVVVARRRGHDPRAPTARSIGQLRQGPERGGLSGDELDRRQRGLAALQRIDHAGDPADGVVEVGEIEHVLSPVDAHVCGRRGCARERGDDAVRVVARRAVDVR
jgi:hypothetical protein